MSNLVMPNTPYQKYVEGSVSDSYLRQSTHTRVKNVLHVMCHTWVTNSNAAIRKAIKSLGFDTETVILGLSVSVMGAGLSKSRKSPMK